MSRLVVQKYGGSSVADLPRIRKVAERIAATAAEGTKVVAVVSAMGNTTNELLALARQASESPDRRELDMLVSVGERITMALLAMCLHEHSLRARSLTGSQSGIVTDETHADAQVVEIRPDRLLAVLEDHDVAIVAGFQGVSRQREVTTLGRGGSDTTAVVLAAALKAEHCEICSDVDGVWSADPRVVPEATRRDAMDLSVAVELARGGAKVLFEDAVRFARDHGVAIRATTTFGPGAGTRLVPSKGQSVTTPSVDAVTADQQLVAVTGPLEAWLEAGARLRRRAGGIAHLDVRNLHGAHPSQAIGIAVVTAVGSAIGESWPILDCARLALRQSSIEVLDEGGQGDALWWQVPGAQADDAVRVLHHALVDVPPSS
ncbi:MAG: aspartate kinase [Myxococcota bacterium]